MKIVAPMTKCNPAYLILAVLAMTAMGSVVVYAAISNLSASTVTTVGGGIRVFTEQSALTPQGIGMSTATGLT
jgi:hypothetical protein